MVDAEDLLLADRTMQLRRQRPRRGEVVPERLLNHDTRVLGQPGPGQPFDDATEQRRRRLQIEDRTLSVRDRGSDPLVGGRIGEITLDVGEARRQTIEHPPLDHLAAGPDRAPHVPAQIGDRPVIDRDTNDRTRQQTSTLEPI